MLEPKPLVLIAEDDEAILELVTTLVQRAGFAVMSAATGVEALDLCASVRPAALILDLGMPELDGFGVLRGLQAARTPFRGGILVLTARHAAADVRQAVRLGAHDFISKPLDNVQLITRLRRLVRLAPEPVVAAARPVEEEAFLL